MRSFFLVSVGFACCCAACGPLPRSAAYGTGVSVSADDANAVSLPLVDLPAADAAFARDEVRGGRALLAVYDGATPRFVRGCAIAAAYRVDHGNLADVEAELRERVRRETESGLGSEATGVTIEVQSSGVHRLAAIARNELPVEGPCTTASHVVVAIETGAYRAAYGRIDRVDTSVRDHYVARDDAPIAVTLLALDTEPPRRIARAAELRHVEARVPGQWSLEADASPSLCALPCDVWVLPGAQAYARDAGSGRALPLPAGPSREHAVVSTGKEEKQTTLAWFALGGGILASVGAAYLSYAFWSGQLGGSPAGSMGGGSWGDAGAGARDAIGEVVGLGVVMPVLAVGAAWIAGWGIRELVRTPEDAPVVRVGVGGVSGAF